jgi:hypothetical protein
MECILGMEFVTHNNVFIKGHNRLVRIPSKNGIVHVTVDEVPNVGGLTVRKKIGKKMHVRLWHVVCDVCVE